MVILGQPANSYTHYITTQEEYSIQWYEGASTFYGPHTLAAYRNRTIHFLPYLSANHYTQCVCKRPALLTRTIERLSEPHIGRCTRCGAQLSPFGNVKIDLRTSYLRWGHSQCDARGRQPAERFATGAHLCRRRETQWQERGRAAVGR